MSNFVRLFALFAEGGIYLDTDIEILKSLDDLLVAPAFLGCESRDPRVNNAIFGSEPGHPFLLRMMWELLSSFTGEEYANQSSPLLTTRLLFELGLKTYSDCPQTIGDVVVYPTRYFYPFYFGESFTPGCVTPETYAIHHWAKRW